MVHKPIVFVSSTSDLRTARDLVSKVLYSMGYEPVWQEIEATDGGELLDVLRKRLDRCALVIQLVGERYGSEPPMPTAEFGRVSYAQFEARYFEETLKRKVIYHILDPTFPTDPATPESDECRDLQSAYRQRIQNTNKPRQTSIGSAQDLEISIRSGELQTWGSSMAPAERQNKPKRTEAGRKIPQAKQIYLDEDVQFTVYRPNVLPPAKWYSFLAFAHLAARRPGALPDDPDPLAELERQANAVLGNLVNEYSHDRNSSSLSIPRDGEISFHLEMPGCELDHERIAFLWRETVHRAEFRVRAPAALLGQTVRGHLTAFLGHLIIADVNFNIRVEAGTAQQARISETARPYRKIFASYSHGDRAVVLNFERHVETTGDRYLRDLRDLRAGEHWNDALKTLIADADIFQLFWSHRSMHSKFVREEWEYAIGLQRPNFVRPVYWEKPIPSDPGRELPPQDLRKLHFHFLGPPAGATRKRASPIWAGATMIAMLLAVGVGFVNHRQTMIREAAKRQEIMRQERFSFGADVLTCIAPKPLFQGQSTPAPLPAGLVDRARIQLQRAGSEDKYTALADITLQRYTEADRIITGLKNRSGTPLGDAIVLLKLEGDNWYQAGQPDKAIGPYEQAVALSPGDIVARNSAALAETSARLGDIAAHQRRAIALAEGTLPLAGPGSAEWAVSQMILGRALLAMPTGDRTDNLRNAVAAFHAALTVRSKDSSPTDWAITQTDLGLALSDMPKGDNGANQNRAMAAYRAALSVLTRDSEPIGWAATENNLAKLLAELSTGDQDQNMRNAIGACEAALTVRTKETYPNDWAVTQNNLGIAWYKLDAGNRGQNLRNAITAFNAALTVCTPDNDPKTWAMTQNNLGNALGEVKTDQSLRSAIAAYTAALTVYSRDTDPADWAMTQNNLGIALSQVMAGDRGENLRKAIAAYESALAVYTRIAHPTDWAMTQLNLGSACYNISNLPGEDQLAWLRRSIASEKAVLLVYTPEQFPHEHNQAAVNLGLVHFAYKLQGGEAARPFDSIAPAE